MELNEDNKESSDIEGPQIEDYWLMINSEWDECIDTQTLTEAEIDATKDASQNQELADRAQKYSANETGISVMISREEFVTATNTGSLDVNPPLNHSYTQEKLTDDKLGTSMKVLTWSESLTAVSQRTETSWGKPNYMQTQPGVKEKTATHLTQDSENEKYSWVEGMESTAERRELEDTMMIAVNTIYRTTRDTTKTAEPPPTLYTASSKQSPHGYVLAQSHQSPTMVCKETPTGTNDLKGEFYSYTH